jgi:DNA processing protein
VATLDWLALSRTPSLGPVRVRRLVQAAGSAEAACEGENFGTVKGISATRAKELVAAIKQSRREAARLIDRSESLGLRVVSPDDSDWPAMLAVATDAPVVLWAWGDFEPRDLHAVGIVGSRQPTQYGREQATRFATGLAENGVTVVSGGAYGVDTFAHRGALRATAGRTLAVLGCGCDVAYPEENEAMFNNIASGRGVILSELPPGTQPRREHFPRRNRIISGLSRGVLVIEAAERSGALITARVAADEHNRPVFALPGRIDNPMAAGPLKLLRDGARLATDIDDVLGDLGPLPQPTRESKEPVEPKLFREVPSTQPVATVEGDDATIAACLQTSDLDIDTLIEKTGLPASTVQARLTMLAIRRVVEKNSTGAYRLRKS